MKNKKILILLIFLFTFFSGFSQKVKLRNGEVLVDNVVWMRYLNCGAMSKGCSLVNLHGDEVIYMQKISTNSTQVSYYGVTETYDSYYEVKFLGTKMYFETKGTPREIMQTLYISRVIDQKGELDIERASRLVEKYGTSLSDAAENNKNNTQHVVPHPQVIIRPDYYGHPYYGHPSYYAYPSYYDYYSPNFTIFVD